MTSPGEFIPYKHGKGVVRRVKTLAGSKKYGLPLGAVITKDAEIAYQKKLKAAKLQVAPPPSTLKPPSQPDLTKLDVNKYPPGTTKGTIAKFIAQKHGVENVDKIFS